METITASEAANGVQPDDLTELWSSVQEKDSFENWEKLIAAALKTDDLDKIRQVFDQFLAQHPLCFGYWQKYATAEHRLADAAAAEAVLERAVASTPYSVEIWIFYINWKRKLPEADVAQIRGLFDRAAQYAAADWNLHRLWDKWIEFESSQKDLLALTRVYCTAVTMPSKELPRYQQSFVEFASNHDLEVMITAEEVATMTTQAKAEKARRPAAQPATAPSGAEAAAGAAGEGGVDAGNAEQAPGADAGEEAPPGVDGEDKPPGADVADVVADVDVDAAEVKAHWLKVYSNAYETAMAQRAQREPFEALIRRNWWHHKPLDASQLLAWWRYLDFVEASNDSPAMFTLFERCLVPCASYPEFWQRYVLFMMQQNSNLDIAESGIQRATTIFCSKRPDMLLFAATFHESTGNIDAARAVLQRLQTEVAPRSLEVVVRHANFERRHGTLDAAIALYEALLSEEKSHGDVDVCVHLTLQFAAFLCDNGRAERAVSVVDDCLTLHPASLALWKGAVALAEKALQGAERVDKVMSLYERALRQTAKSAEAGADAAMAQDGDSAAASGGEVNQGGQTHKAFSLTDREALAANATAFADACADARAVLRCERLTQELQLEFLAVADTAATSKRAASSAAAGQPAAKRPATSSDATPAAAVAAWQAAQQPAHAQYYQQPGYDYSAYYSQQPQQHQYQAGYYSGYY